MSSYNQSCVGQPLLTFSLFLPLSVRLHVQSMKFLKLYFMWLCFSILILPLFIFLPPTNKKVKHCCFICILCFLMSPVFLKFILWSHFYHYEVISPGWSVWIKETMLSLHIITTHKWLILTSSLLGILISVFLSLINSYQQQMINLKRTLDPTPAVIMVWLMLKMKLREDYFFLCKCISYFSICLSFLTIVWATNSSLDSGVDTDIMVIFPLTADKLQEWLFNESVSA